MKLLVILISLAFIVEAVDKKRKGKIFSLFSIVRIPDQICTGSDGISTGNCYSASEMSSRGLTSLGTCGSGFGQCGAKIVTETGSALEGKTSYLRNPNFPAATTTTNIISNDIVVTDGDVCQIRLDFVQFELTAVTAQTLGTFGTAGPPVAGPVTCATAGDYVQITSDLPSSARSDFGIGDLCGKNTGQHIYLGDFNSTEKDVPGTVAKIRASLTTSALYNIKVTQIDCKTTDQTMIDLRAPMNCRQYYRASTGTMTSLNFGANGSDRYEASLDYQICIRRAITDCQIKYVRTPSGTLAAGMTSVGQMEYGPYSPATPAIADHNNCYDITIATNLAQNACGLGLADGCVTSATADFIQIPEGRYLGSASTTLYAQNDIFCGVGVGWDTAQSTAAALDNLDDGKGVISQAGGLWSIRFHSQPGLIPDKESGTLFSRLGFSLDYTKSSTCDPDFRTCLFSACQKAPVITRGVGLDGVADVTVAEASLAEESTGVSFEQVLHELSWLKNMLANTVTTDINTTTTTTTTSKTPRYDTWNRFPYRPNQARNIFQNPPRRN